MIDNAVAAHTHILSLSDLVFRALYSHPPKSLVHTHTDAETKSTKGFA